MATHELVRLNGIALVHLDLRPIWTYPKPSDKEGLRSDRDDSIGRDGRVS